MYAIVSIIYNYCDKIPAELVELMLMQMSSE